MTLKSVSSDELLPFDPFFPPRLTGPVEDITFKGCIDFVEAKGWGGKSGRVVAHSRPRDLPAEAPSPCALMARAEGRESREAAEATTTGSEPHVAH